MRSLFLTFIVGAACNASAQPFADLIVKNAKVYTVNTAQPRVKAFAIAHGKYIAVGNNRQMKRYKGADTEVINAAGSFVMPGFMEGHGHIHSLGFSLQQLNFSKTNSFDEVVTMVEQAVKTAAPGEWIIGNGWHQEKWAVKPNPSFSGYPYHFALSAVSPNNPVLLNHVSGHAILVNQKAMEIAGIDEGSISQPGGKIVKDAKGTVLGVLEENAELPVITALTSYYNKQSVQQQQDQWWQAFQQAEKECLRFGITSFADAGSSFTQLKWMNQKAQLEKLAIRHWVMIKAGLKDLNENVESFKLQNTDTGFLNCHAVKVSFDGALGSYGAWLLAPYNDRPGFYGQNTFSEAELRKIATFCKEHQLQLGVHAIGDRANRSLLDIYEESLGKLPGNDFRWRVEHAQHTHPQDRPRFKELGVIASMQGIHCTSDAPFVESRLGYERAKEGAYTWQSFLQLGVVVNSGTDVPVESASPFGNLFALVTRETNTGARFFENEKMTRQQALYSYTMANAFAQKQERVLGSIEPGKYADFIVLSKNLATCADQEILQTRVLKTYVNGQLKYQAN